MSSLLKHIKELPRRLFGRWEVLNPQASVVESPYTFFLPSENELLALRQDDLVKINIRSVPAGDEWDSERMWVSLTEVDQGTLTGVLSNEPDEMPQLRLGTKLTFTHQNVLDIRWHEDRSIPPPSPTPRREYWDRCLVDECVTYNGVPVHYLYREEPDPQDDDEYPDSGWRIRGDYRTITDEQLDARKVEYIALGRALNADDSWLNLIDAPVGSAFIRNWDTNEFEPEEVD